MSGSTDLFVGIMSGTSLDGIDVAVARFSYNVDCIAHESFPFGQTVRDLLYQASTTTEFDLNTFTRLHFLLAGLYADAVKQTLSRHAIASDTIRAIGLHGQTVRHLPKPFALTKELPDIKATFQIGSGSALAALSGIDVVSDFRSADVALGGEGAPLVPMFDVAFLRDDTKTRIALNIGGIANITIIPPRSGSDRILAYDTGPGNMIIDALMQRYFSKPYDDDGKVAANGKVNTLLLERWLAQPYFSERPPKSTGRELFGSEFIRSFIILLDNSPDFRPEDVVATATEFTARSIANELLSYSGDLIASGGGTRNAFLMQRLKALLPNLSVQTSDEFGIPSQAKEAIAFAYFAKAFLNNEKIHLPETTGASRQVILGSLAKGK